MEEVVLLGLAKLDILVIFKSGFLAWTVCSELRVQKMRELPGRGFTHLESRGQIIISIQLPTTLPFGKLTKR